MKLLSYIHRPATRSHIYRTIPTVLDEAAHNHPKKEAYVFITESSRSAVTYQDLADKSYIIAAGLLDLGLKPGDRIAIFGDSNADWLYLDYAAIRINVLLIRMPVSLALSENLPTFLARHKCKVLFVDKDKIDSLKEYLPSIEALCQIEKVSEAEESMQMVVLMKTTKGDAQLGWSLRVLLELGYEDSSTVRVNTIQDSMNPDDAAVVFATSGSTGVPKLCACSHVYAIQLYYNVFGQEDEFGNRDDMCYLNNKPFNWAGSFMYVPIALNIKLCHVGSDQDHVLDIIDKEKVNYATFPVFTVERFFEGILECKSLRVLILGGENIPANLVKRLNQGGKTVSVGYGSTEVYGASAVFSNQTPRACEEVLKFVPTPGCEVKVCSETTAVVEVGQVGMVWIRSLMSMNCYLDLLEESQAKKNASGWVNTEDLGIIHKCGGLQIIGRATDTISKGSIKIHPITIEAMLKKHPKVDSAVVVGIADDKYGHEIAAVVTAKEKCTLTIEELETHAELAGITTFRVELFPKRFAIVEDIPKLASGKIDTAEIRNKFLVTK